MKRNNIFRTLCILCYAIFLIVSLLFGFNPGKEIGADFLSFSKEMLTILPPAFILIGLFEIWVKRETIEKHFGEGSGFRGYLWGVLLACTTVGGLYVAFPVAYSLYSKGAKLSIVFCYIGSSAICRVPMTIFEASFMGIKFTAIRILFSLPLVIITSILMGNYLTKRNYEISRTTK